ncbi:NmrA family NAD(P)-binding protein [Psychroserpens jangbogonensis]|uniref:NmrA family NAD(P)-binding protein n=1 Tax=Psychroserpens jangbogonensis TaxID=1484460 RepID=UPI00053DD571|nr:NmrA family NAD(P)-binding protein [Psychroserpens jangbogonensis]
METQILITGATGTTSQYAIQHLVDKGIKVRAMVRTIDDRSKHLETLGIEIVKGDFLDIDSLRLALKGVNRAFFCYPFADHLPKAAAYFAKAAKEENVEMVVEMSQMGAHENTPSPATQNHLITESILDWADVGAVHIRPGLFAWNYLGFAAPTVATQQKFYYPNSEANYTIIHPKDIGEVVAEILSDDELEKHIGKRYDLTGNKTYSASDVAQSIGEIINQDIEYIPITVDQWIEAIKDHPSINPFLAKHLREFSSEVSDGRFNRTTTVVKDITGHEPRTFEQYIKEHEAAFIN